MPPAVVRRPFRLVAIPFSHYNEKARWALDRFAVPFRQASWLPGLHLLPVALATHFGRDGRADGQSSRLSTPVVVTDRGERLCDSAAILRYVSERFGAPDASLYPTEESSKIERWLGEELGPETRVLAYHFAFAHRPTLRFLMTRNVGRVQVALGTLLTPFLARGMTRSMGLGPDRLERSMRAIDRLMDEVERRLGSRRYLVADRFTAADLTFACMLAPALVPSRDEGFGATLPPLSNLPPDYAAFAQNVRARPAGAFALRLFAEERRPRIATTSKG